MRLENLTFKVKFLLYFYLKFDKIFQIFTEFLLKLDFKSQISRPDRRSSFLQLLKLEKICQIFSAQLQLWRSCHIIENLQLPRGSQNLTAAGAAPTDAAP